MSPPPAGERRPEALELPPERRDELAMALARLCALGRLNEQARAEAERSLLPLARAAEDRVRAAMAAELADADWAPAAVIRWLAYDRLEVARPVLERSMMLSEADLIALADSDAARRLVLAGRISISEALCAALSRHREPQVIRKLADNPGARVGERSAADFMAVARGDRALQDALASREQLPRAFARALFVFAAMEVRAALIARFPDLPRDRLDAATELAETAAAAPQQPAERLADRLDENGKLSAAGVLKALREGRHEVFDAFLSRMTGLPADQWRRALSTSSVRAWLLAARAIGVDIPATPAGYADLVRAGRAHPVDGRVLDQAAEEIYGMYDREQAKLALRRLASPGSMT